MKYWSLIAALAIISTAASISSSHAVEINPRFGMEPGVQSKVNKIYARTWRTRGGPKSYTSADFGSGCGSLNVGPTIEKGADTPREVIIVAKEIINIGRRCR